MSFAALPSFSLPEAALMDGQGKAGAAAQSPAPQRTGIAFAAARSYALGGRWLSSRLQWRIRLAALLHLFQE